MYCMETKKNPSTVPVLVDFDHARIGVVQLPLQIGAAPLGFENQLRQRIGRFLNNF